MIQVQTQMTVADNSGAKKVACIRVLGGTRKRYARVGDIIIVAVKEALPHSKVKKGDVMRAVVVEVKRLVAHPLYHKIIRRRARIKAHDPNNSCQVGDKVLLEETRPLSRDKRWRVREVLEKAQ